MSSRFVSLKPALFLAVVRRVFTGPERGLALGAVLLWPGLSRMVGNPCARCERDRLDHTFWCGRCPVGA